MTSPTAPATVELERLTKQFRSPEGRPVVAVDDISLSFSGGSFVTLLGPSGCGKTTTLRMIAGFETPTSGRILLDGTDVSRRTPDKRQMGMVFQSYALFPHLTVFENVAYGLRLRRRSGAALREAVERTLQLVNLQGLGQRRPSELSGGQQQRVALARAMAIEPRVLLFDEPLSNLDAKLRVALRTEIRRIQQQLGITSVYVTHDQSEAMALSDVVVVMNAGRVEQAGPPDEVYRRPATRFVADFIGRANFVEGLVERVDGTGTIDVSLFGRVLSVPAAVGQRPGQTAVVVLRPESIRVGVGEMRGRVRRATFLGPMAEYEVEVGDEVAAGGRPGVDGAWAPRAGRGGRLVSAPRAGLRVVARRDRGGSGADRPPGGGARGEVIERDGALARWLELGESLGPSTLRLVLVDIDGVMTPGEGGIADPGLLARVASWNDAAAVDLMIPAISLCSGRQAPYVELMAQLTRAFLPCLFEHGAGMLQLRGFRFTFSPLVGPAPWRAVAAVREALGDLLDSGRAFVQPGKEATLTLYPLGSTTVAELARAAERAIAGAGSPFTVTPNLRGIEVRPHGIDKGAGMRWLAQELGIALPAFAGVGDADDDLTFLGLVGYPAAPANASVAVRSMVQYVSREPFGEGLLEILAHLVDVNRRRATA